MRKYLLGLLVFTVFFTALPYDAHAFWIWSRKHQKWRNPEGVPLSSPAAQLEYARGFYEDQSYKKAYNEFRKVLKNFPDSKEAPEAQYYKALCLLGLGKPREAFAVFQRVVDSYPYSDRISEIIKQQLEIAESLFERDDVKLLGVKFDPDTWTEQNRVFLRKPFIRIIPDHF
jgi:tetratricopeptide (TPR) repeat protein